MLPCLTTKILKKGEGSRKVGIRKKNPMAVLNDKVW